MSNFKNSTVAIIDSGIGGISILRQLIDKYHSGNFIYLADNLHMPYGNKNATWLKKRMHHLITMLQHQYQLDYIVLACNTASTVVNKENYINLIPMEFNEQFIYFATYLTKKNLSNATVIANKTLAKQIENNVFNTKKLNMVVKNAVKTHGLNELNQFVLGCTHYELVKDLFIKYCPKSEIINNSSFIIENIKLETTKEINIKILLTKQSASLEQKILTLIRGNE